MFLLQETLVNIGDSKLWKRFTTHPGGSCTSVDSLCGPSQSTLEEEWQFYQPPTHRSRKWFRGMRCIGRRAGCLFRSRHWAKQFLLSAFMHQVSRLNGSRYSKDFYFIYRNMTNPCMLEETSTILERTDWIAPLYCRPVDTILCRCDGVSAERISVMFLMMTWRPPKKKEL